MIFQNHLLIIKPENCKNNYFQGNLIHKIETALAVMFNIRSYRPNIITYFLSKVLFLNESTQ